MDLAREHGLSTQAIRNYEEEGILPASERTPHGYRLYTALHAQALRAFVALVPGHGHHCASQIMRSLNHGDLDGALTLIDVSHGQLLRDRETLAAVETALRDLTSTEPPAQPERAVTFIGPLARQLGIRPATLRTWESAGLISPQRDRATGYRLYTATDVRDAHLAHQLRRGGYLLHQIAPLIAQVRTAGGVGPLGAALQDWHTRLTDRRLAVLAAAAELTTYVRDLGPLAQSPNPAP